MIARESVQSRLQGEHGISFTEFTYQLIQAHDYWWLRTRHDCELQVGGSDQWGNIVAGVDLVRRRGAGAVHGLTWPLLLRADGTKFGKSASGENVWLDPDRTSPYRFFQFWVQTDDADVERFLFQLTLLPLAEIEAILAEHRAAPARRIAQHALARSVTSIVHGPTAAEQAEAAAQVIFGAGVVDVPAEVLDVLVDEIPTVRVPGDVLTAGLPALEALVLSELCTSRKDARRTLEQGGGYCNEARIGLDDTLTPASLLHDRYLLLRRGRKAHALLVVG
jgi:tyrosyl-tRNA synthetase